MKNWSYFWVALLLFTSCKDKDEAATVTAVGFYSTDLFKDVQLLPVFPDSKTFVDCTPKKNLTELVALYDQKKGEAGFDLRQFVLDNFEVPVPPQTNFKADTTRTMEQHITLLWDVLQRPADKHNQNSSLIPLPNPYIVPGGRFAEIYYWDSYFTMVGLQAQGRYDIIGNMVNNFAFLIDSIGFIPNGNRNYYQGRSQPPFFTLMVELLEDNDSTVYKKYLPQIQKEYMFWMHGADQLKKACDAVEHVVMMPDGVILNRYFDKIPEPRPEAYKEDFNLAKSSTRNAAELYTDLRAAAESGIDFSTRWFQSGKGLESIHTTDFVAVDLNSLLYHVEKTLSRYLRKSGDIAQADQFEAKAEQRQKAVIDYCWNSTDKFFYDYDFKTGTIGTVRNLAASYPLFVKLATPEQAKGVGDILTRDFLKAGGFTTTLNNSGQQWDAPNGWAPLQWMSYQGLRNYKLDATADEMRTRWLKLCDHVYRTTGKMTEKYNVVDVASSGGGGEYPNQDGFGWTNGITLRLLLRK